MIDLLLLDSEIWFPAVAAVAGVVFASLVAIFGQLLVATWQRADQHHDEQRDTISKAQDLAVQYYEHLQEFAPSLTGVETTPIILQKNQKKARVLRIQLDTAASRIRDAKIRGCFRVITDLELDGAQKIEGRRDVRRAIPCINEMVAGKY